MSSAPTSQTPPPLPPDEFYVGYSRTTPRGVARRTRAAVVAVMISSIATAAGLSMAFRAPAAAVWEETTAEYAGQVIERPYPMLRLVEKNAPQRALLVSTGKHGAADRMRGLDGVSVRIKGTALRRDGRLMIEIADDGDAIAKVESASAVPANARESSRGRQTITGEIIDPKCFFGAMKPGEGKLHKACAIRCISGGIPPMLAARNAAGEITYYLLVSASGGPVKGRVLPFVAEPVSVTGMVSEIDGLLTLRVDDSPEGIVRR